MRGRRGAVRGRVSALVALCFASALAATYAIPAYGSLPTGADRAGGSGLGVQSAEHQGLTVPAETTTTLVSRDKVTVVEAPEPDPVPPAPPPGMFSARASTFTNDPNSAVQWPFDFGVPITDGFGPRVAPCSGCSSFHEGIDMTPGAGTPIHAIAAGVVSEVGDSAGGYGVYVMIDHQIDGQTVTSLYAHMQEGSRALSVGEHVTVRQIVGRVGNTGASTGAHLHLGIAIDGTPVDPYAWLTSKVQ